MFSKMYKILYNTYTHNSVFPHRVFVSAETSKKAEEKLKEQHKKNYDDRVDMTITEVEEIEFHFCDVE